MQHLIAGSFFEMIKQTPWLSDELFIESSAVRRSWPPSIGFSRPGQYGIMRPGMGARAL
jgi:hypothetical protein